MKNAVDIVVGGLLGDEGKGKLVGRIGKDYDAVLRVNASTNAGHCVSYGDKHYVTRQLPSVFFPTKTDLVIAPGALLNLEAFHDELISRPDLKELHGKVKVASTISLVIKPYIEKDQGVTGDVLDSTRQGTGPSAAARALRHSLRLFDIEQAVRNHDAYEMVLEKMKFTTKEILPLRYENDAKALNAYAKTELDRLIDLFKKIEKCVGTFCVDYTSYLQDSLTNSKKNILIEGCNGLLLDNLHGMHPYVTSASTNIGAMLAGANFSHANVKQVIIVISAYSTCLGKRPFPTEVSDHEAGHFYQNCNEIDVAEMKKRRIGWFDAPALKKALVGSSGSVLHMNKLDVFSGLKEIKICTHYILDGKKIDVLPDSPYIHHKLKPHFETVPGWSQSLQACKKVDDLPKEAKGYLQFISKIIPLPIASVGVGPENEQFLRII